MFSLAYSPFSKILTIILVIGVCGLGLEARTTSLGETPQWDDLEVYDGVLSANGAMSVLMSVYVPHASLAPWFVNEGNQLGVLREDIVIEEGVELPPESWQRIGFFEGRKAQMPPRFWRTREEIAAESRVDAPLAGLRVALDPGHIGGDFAKMEQRWFRLSVDDKPVAEGDMTLFLAQKLKQRLENLGATVMLVRESDEPITDKRPKDFVGVAKEILKKEYSLLSGVASGKRDSIRLERLSRLLFYRVSEIHARAERVNEDFKPDLVLALHFNAAPWGASGESVLTEVNHTHVLVNGAYSQEEIAQDDIRFELVERLMQGTHVEEIALADVMARSLAKQTRLPPFQYTGENAVRVSDNPHVWARNLLANRIYRCPVIYLEPYCMNNREVYARVQRGDYGGTEMVGGRECISIYEEYTRSVVDALVAYYGLTASKYR